MTDQLTLLPTTLEERFARFIDDNPHVVVEVVRVARHFKARGRRGSIAAVFEELRERIHTTGDVYNLNNSYRAPMARLVMARFLDLDGYFATRRSKVDR